VATFSLYGWFNQIVGCRLCLLLVLFSTLQNFISCVYPLLRISSWYNGVFSLKLVAVVMSVERRLFIDYGMLCSVENEWLDFAWTHLGILLDLLYGVCSLVELHIKKVDNLLIGFYCYS